MAELRTVTNELLSKLSRNHQLRQRVVAALADAFTPVKGKTTSPEKIQNAQRVLKSNVEQIINDLILIDDYLSAQGVDSEPVLSDAVKLIKKEITHFGVLKEEFFSVLKSLPIGIIDMNTVRNKLQVDKIIVTVDRLNVLVGNVKFQHESEEYLLKELRVKAA